MPAPMGYRNAQPMPTKETSPAEAAATRKKIVFAATILAVVAILCLIIYAVLAGNKLYWVR